MENNIRIAGVNWIKGYEYKEALGTSGNLIQVFEAGVLWQQASLLTREKQADETLALNEKLNKENDNLVELNKQYASEISKLRERNKELAMAMSGVVSRLTSDMMKHPAAINARAILDKELENAVINFSDKLKNL